MKNHILYLFLICFIGFSSGCLFESKLEDQMQSLDTAGGWISGIVEIPDSGDSNKSLNKARPGARVYLMSSVNSWYSAMNYKSYAPLSETADSSGRYTFRHLSGKHTYKIMIDTDDDGKPESIEEDVEVLTDLKSYVRERNTTDSVILSVKNDRLIYKPGDTMEIKVSGYAVMERTIHVEIRNEKTGGLPYWVSGTKTVKGPVSETFTAIVPNSWPSSATGADYMVVVCAGDNEIDPDPFTVSGNHPGDLVPPDAVTLSTAAGSGYLKAILTWTQSQSDDFGVYQVHGSENSGFTPSAENLIHTGNSRDVLSCEAGYPDESRTMNYKVIVVDTVGNKSAPSNELSFHSGLIGYWKFEEDAGANVIADSSGNGYHGSRVNSADTVAGGKLGRGLELVSDGDYVDIPGMTCPVNKTLSLWVNLRNFDESYNTLVEFDNDDPWLGILDTGNANLYNYVESIEVLPLNEWVHIAVTSDGAESRLYINGVFDSAGDPCTDTGTGMGLGYHSGDTSVDGFIDEVKIYDRALSASEIQDYYSAVVSQ